MKFAQFSIFICAMFASASPLVAHEFWIEPAEFQVEKDAPFVADLRNGQLFDGTGLSFFEKNNTRFDVTMGDSTTPIAGRMGDRPAIQLLAPQQDGLMILTHEAAPATITYREWAKFEKFIKHKDFKGAQTTHTERGWPDANFKETYTRHSKSLVAVGNGAGVDRAFGLKTEFVALDNPYEDGFDGVLDVSLLYQGIPRADAQIEVYTRDAAGRVAVSITRTNQQGLAKIPVEKGMEYLLDAVVLRPVEEATTAKEDPIWETLWASLTFAVPEN